MAGKFVDLLDYIDWSGVECLNQKHDKELGNALKQGYREDDGLYVESDTDEQLLIYIPFNQSVKLGEVLVKATDKDCAPQKIKIFINRHSMGFDQASDEPATQEFELSEEVVEETTLSLKFVKFQSVQSITIFIEDNQGDEETTKLNKLQLKGVSGEKMNVGDIKKVDDK
mmetsp:Transcript_3294/g.6007  ORF Transcript_3294/g.6007 Transcript_3294/m.6007 type:complete len:170 (-) Transcript_3294:138-647(-)